MRHRVVNLVAPAPAPALLVAVPSHERPPPPLPAVGGDGRQRAAAVVACVCVVAWGLVIGAQVTGLSRHLRHDAVLDGASAPWEGWALFLGGWLVMVAAMMLPATAPVIRRVRQSSEVPSPSVVAAFLGGFLAVWGVAGHLLLGFDLVVHRVVDAVPALSTRPSLVAATLLAAAGAAQLAPSTRRWLVAAGEAGEAVGTTWSAAAVGRRHAARCVLADGPLMLVMFAAGGRLGWMVLLTAVMAAERSPGTGDRVARAVGVALLLGAVLAALDVASVLGPVTAG